MQIGVVPAPLEWELWPQAKAYLDPARLQGGFADCIEPDEELFAVLDGDELLAVATAWFNCDLNMVEIKLVGGREHRRWLKALDEAIGRAAKVAGATALCAWGRKGWTKRLSVMGWAVTKLDDGSYGYRRTLKD